jgi:hypothetical protein
MVVPHLVQNLSLGSASFPQFAQVHPVRRKRASRALIFSPAGPPPGPPPPAGLPPPAGPPAPAGPPPPTGQPPISGPPPLGGQLGGGGTTVGGGGTVPDVDGGTIPGSDGGGTVPDAGGVDGVGGTTVASEAESLAASYRALASGPDSRSRLMDRTVSLSRCDRSGAVVASAVACRLSRSTACSTCSVGASVAIFRYAYQSSCCRIGPMEPHAATGLPTDCRKSTILVSHPRPQPPNRRIQQAKCGFGLARASPNPHLAH